MWFLSQSPESGGPCCAIMSVWRVLLVAAVYYVPWEPAFAIVGGKQAAAPLPDAAVVFVQKFGRSARIEGIKNDARGYYTFLGIRYAEAPTGQRRFQRASLARLEGEVSGGRACAPCAQPHPAYPDKLVGSEDCLCINIYAPKLPASENGSPVLFWVHGGGFRQGSASYYGGEHLAQKDTILVSVQYRLGSLGFLSNGMKELSGNVGLLDLSTALQWVLDYIEFFGGDPERVVTIGQGSGGSAASLLALSPLARDNVRGVAALSGAPLAPGALDAAPGRRASALAEHTGCPAEPAHVFIACLKKLPLQQIIQADSKISKETNFTEGIVSEASGVSGSAARVEGEPDERGLPPLVSRAPSASLARGDQRVPLLTGVVRDETARAVFGKNSKSLTERLLKVPDFIDKEIISPLKKQLVDLVAVPLHNAAAAVPPAAAGLLSLSSYYNVMNKRSANVTKGLLKIVEATSDAFFNFPAFASVDKWSTKASAFLYRFEYLGNKTKGRHFLAGLPLVGAGEGAAQDGFVGHGDELAYLFEPLDAEAKPLAAPAAVSTQDDRVRDLFTGLISRFAHNVSLVDKEAPSFFSSASNRYLQIGSDIKIDDDFRFCQMALWGGVQQRLQSAACSVVAALSEELAPSVVPAVSAATGLLTHAVGGGGARPAASPDLNNLLNPYGGRNPWGI